MANDPDSVAKVNVSLSRHSVHTRDQATRLSNSLKLGDCHRERDILIEAALWHDLGKAHDVFKARCGLSDDEAPIAKTPDYDGRKRGGRNRKFFRHELASALAYLAHHDWDEEASLAAYLIAAHHGKVRTRLRALPIERPAEAGKLFARGVVDGDVLRETTLGAMTIPVQRSTSISCSWVRDDANRAGKRALRRY